MVRTIYLGRHEGLFERINFTEFMQKQGATAATIKGKKHNAYSAVFGIKPALTISYEYKAYPVSNSPEQTTLVTIEGNSKEIAGLEKRIFDTARKFKVPSDVVGGSE